MHPLMQDLFNSQYQVLMDNVDWNITINDKGGWVIHSSNIEAKAQCFQTPLLSMSNSLPSGSDESFWEE